MNHLIDEIMGDLVAGIQALREAESRPEPLPVPRPALRLVQDCGSLVQTRNRDDELSEMAFYARNIRAFRTGEIDRVQGHPKLALVRSRDPINTTKITP